MTTDYPVQLRSQTAAEKNEKRKKMKKERKNHHWDANLETVGRWSSVMSQSQSYFDYPWTMVESSTSLTNQWLMSPSSLFLLIEKILLIQSRQEPVSKKKRK